MTRSAAVVVTALAVALLPGCGGSSSSSDSSQATSPGAAAIVSADSLREAAAEATTPIYWAGGQSGTKLELSRPEKGRTYVRYLAGDASAGNKRADFLTVGTYAQPNAAASLRRQAKRSGGEIGHAPRNAVVYSNRASSQSVYLAYPGAPVEVEVFDPNFKRALQLVESGQIIAVE